MENTCQIVEGSPLDLAYGTDSLHFSCSRLLVNLGEFINIGLNLRSWSDRLLVAIVLREWQLASRENLEGFPDDKARRVGASVECGGGEPFSPHQVVQSGERVSGVRRFGRY